MTDRINALTVVLSQDLRVDDAEALLIAIRQLRGVISVQVNVSGLTDHIALERARREIKDKLWQALER